MQDEALAELEELFIKRHNELLLGSGAFEETIAAYDRLECETIASLRQHNAEHLSIDIRRTLSASRLAAALDKNAEIEPAVDLFRASKELGYDDAEKRLVAAAIFARICLKNGKEALAVNDLEEALNGATTDTHHYEPIQKLLDELRARRPT